MNITVLESGGETQVTESCSTISVIDHSPTVEISDEASVIEVRETPATVQVIQVGHTVMIQPGVTSIVEVQTQGPKGDSASSETGPSFTYTSGVVSRIDYDSGNYRLFTYSGGNITRIDYVQPTKTVRKDFSYNVDGSLAEITQTEI